MFIIVYYVYLEKGDVMRSSLRAGVESCRLLINDESLLVPCLWVFLDVVGTVRITSLPNDTWCQKCEQDAR